MCAPELPYFGAFILFLFILFCRIKRPIAYPLQMSIRAPDYLSGTQENGHFGRPTSDREATWRARWDSNPRLPD